MCATPLCENAGNHSLVAHTPASVFILFGPPGNGTAARYGDLDTCYACTFSAQVLERQDALSSSRRIHFRENGGAISAMVFKTHHMEILEQDHAATQRSASASNIRFNHHYESHPEHAKCINGPSNCSCNCARCNQPPQTWNELVDGATGLERLLQLDLSG